MKLYDEICEACQESRKKKQSLRMLFSTEEFHQYLQSAFDHFADNLHDPFDFVQTSLVNSPIPPDIGGNILKLAINIMTVKAKRNSRKMLSADDIFYELSFLVPSCIMLDEERQSRCGELHGGRDHCVLF